jgi:YidC/Oxa1 family membrane protein insertase
MGSDNRRILIATIASVVILVAWQAIFPPPKPAPPSTPAAAGNAAAPAPAPAPVPSPAPVAPVEPVAAAPEELVTLEGSGFTVVLSSHGGALHGVLLRDPKFRQEKDGKTIPIELVHGAPGLPLPLSVAASAELGGNASPLLDPSARAPMRVVSKDATSVVFEGRAGAVSLRKSYRLTGKPYQVAVELEAGGAPAAGTLSVLYTGFMPPATSSGGIFSGPPLEFVRPVCRAGSSSFLQMGGGCWRQRQSGCTAWQR